ncbi:MAG: HAD-IA family hydrolase [Leptospirales bacterium]|nr:HAD-IA family hydrolase [Leptospirales bacterium]
MRGLFIDLDGTLADSLGVMREAYAAFLKRFNKPSSEEEFNSLNGPPLQTVVSLLKEKHGLEESVDELLSIYWSLLDSAYSEVKPINGATELLNLAQASGWKCAVVTSNNSRLCRNWLEANKIADLISCVIGGEMVTAGKPDPEPYLTAIRQTECQASQSICIEDSLSGITSGLAAGLTVFGFSPHSVETKMPPLPSGVIAVRELREVSEWLARTNS